MKVLIRKVYQVEEFFKAARAASIDWEARSEILLFFAIKYKRHTRLSIYIVRP